MSLDASLIDHREGHRPELVRFCRRMGFADAQADDIVQEVLIAACRSASDSVVNWRAWLYRAVRNRCLDTLRARPREEKFSEVLQEPGGGSPLWRDSATTPGAKALKTERAEILHASLGDLDEDLRTIIVLRFWECLPREEIAEILGLARSGVAHRLNRALQALAERVAVLKSSAGSDRKRP